MKIPTTSVLQFLRLLAMLAMIGYYIEAGSIITSVIVSFSNPEAAKNLYKGLDLSQIRTYNVALYYVTIAFIVSISIMKAYVWQLAVKMLSGFNLTNPFQAEMGSLLRKISLSLLSIWIIGLIAGIMSTIILKKAGLTIGYDFKVDEFLFMAGLVYIISQVFKRGIEIQSENELTV